jgi:N-acetylmuramoyl-L-alanine amidase CwlA
MTETTALLTPNQWSRPGGRINVRGIIIHWVENAGQPSEGVREFFEMRKYGKLDYGSAHDIIDLDGEVMHVIPYSEMAYHVGGANYLPPALSLFGAYPNNATIGVELTHPDWTGRPTAETLRAAVDLCSGLCINYGLNPMERIRTHSWVTGKQTPRGRCHKYFEENPSDWIAFLEWVKSDIGESV